MAEYPHFGILNSYDLCLKISSSKQWLQAAALASAAAALITNINYGQQDDILPPILAKFPPSAPEIIKFRIHVRDMLRANVRTEETNAVVASFQVEDDVYRLLTYKFSPMGVPENCQREILAPAILNFAKKILADPQNACRKWIGVVVEVTILAPIHRHKEEDEDQNQSKPSSSNIVRRSVREAFGEKARERSENSRKNI